MVAAVFVRHVGHFVAFFANRTVFAFLERSVRLPHLQIGKKGHSHSELFTVDV